MASESAEDKKITFAVMRLITPALVAVLGTLCLMQIDDIKKDIRETKNSVSTMTISVAEVQSTVKGIQERVIRDETIYDRRGFR